MPRRGREPSLGWSWGGLHEAGVGGGGAVAGCGMRFGCRRDGSDGRRGRLGRDGDGVSCDSRWVRMGRAERALRLHGARLLPLHRQLDLQRSGREPTSIRDRDSGRAGATSSAFERPRAHTGDPGAIAGVSHRQDSHSSTRHTAPRPEPSVVQRLADGSRPCLRRRSLLPWPFAGGS